MTQCIRTLAPPKGRGGMLSGRLKYIIKKKNKYQDVKSGDNISRIVKAVGGFMEQSKR